MKKNKLRKQQQREQQEQRLQQRLQQEHATSGEKGGRVGGALTLATPRKKWTSLSSARSGMSGMDPENDSDVVFDELPEVEQDAYLRHKILSAVNELKRLAHPGFSGQQSMLRCKTKFVFFKFH